MEHFKRKTFWVDTPLQLQMLGYILVLVAASLLIVSFSIFHGIDQASEQSRQIYFSSDWIHATLRGPLVVASLLSLCASAVIGLFWSHRFVAPLRVLAAGVTRLREGDLSTMVRIRATDTHQELVDEFCRMQESLRLRVAKDRNKAAALSQRLEELKERLPGAVQSDLEVIAKELRGLTADYRL